MLPTVEPTSTPNHARADYDRCTVEHSDTHPDTHTYDHPASGVADIKAPVPKSRRRGPVRTPSVYLHILGHSIKQFSFLLQHKAC